MVSGPIYTTILAEDVETSAAFYEQHLGWERSEVEPMGGVMFKTEPMIFIILPAAAGSPYYQDNRVGHGMQFTVQCNDLDARHAAMTAAGVRIESPILDVGWQRMFAFRDPDGFVIVLAEDN